MGLLAYSGIATKIRAMESHLITEQQFRKMAMLEDVRSAADYFNQNIGILPSFTASPTFPSADFLIFIS